MDCRTCVLMQIALRVACACTQATARWHPPTISLAQIDDVATALPEWAARRLFTDLQTSSTRLRATAPDALAGLGGSVQLLKWLARKAQGSPELGIGPALHWRVVLLFGAVPILVAGGMLLVMWAGTLVAPTAWWVWFLCNI